MLGLRGRANGVITVGADGRRSRIARDVDAAITRLSATPPGAALYGYWSGVEADGYEWAFRPGTSAGLISTNGGLTCVYVGVPQQRFLDNVRHDHEGGIVRILWETSPELARRVTGGRRHGRVPGFPGMPGWMRRPRGPGWALVGNAGYFKDPITAHGITDALRDAELLARDLHRSLSNGHASDECTYEQVRNNFSVELFVLTNRIATFDWDLTELQGLHLATSDAMKHEYDFLATLDPLTTAAVAA